MSIRLFFAWYDLWVGAYIDRENRTIYVCILPTLVLSFSLRSKMTSLKWAKAFITYAMHPRTEALQKKAYIGQAQSLLEDAYAELD